MSLQVAREHTISDFGVRQIWASGVNEECLTTTLPQSTPHRLTLDNVLGCKGTVLYDIRLVFQMTQSQSDCSCMVRMYRYTSPLMIEKVI